jgi:penicillin-binding protein 2
MVSAAAALQEHIIDDRFTYNCPGFFPYGDHVFKCDVNGNKVSKHGSVNVEHAIQVSCDVFFYQLILKEGLDIWRKYALMFGFGQKTGIDIGEENSGLIPTDEYFAKAYHTQNWPKGVLVSLGIGQGDMGVTPLQMACYVGALGTGTWVQPHVVHAIYNSIAKDTEYIKPKMRKIPLDSTVWNVIRRGMYDVVNTPGGTAYASRLPDIVMCGKTGTAQVSKGNPNAWFIAYAPADHPRIAIAVMAENAGWGAETAAPIASKLIEYYLMGRRPDAPAAPADSLKTSAQPPLHAEAIH